MFHRVLRTKDSDGMANSVDPDQTAPLGAVWSGSTLIAQTSLPENLRSLSIYLSISLYVLTPEGDIRRVPVNQVLEVSFFFFFCAMLVVLVVSERSQCLPYNAERQAR